MEMFDSVPIWGNSLLRRANSPFFYHCLINSNVNVIADIWDFDNRKFYSYDGIVERHGLIKGFDYMLYNSIISAIPTLWKHQLQNVDMMYEAETKIERISKNSPCTKWLYWRYIEERVHFADSTCLLWAKDLKICPDLLGVQWEERLMDARRISKAVKLRNLQYKILNRILVTNVLRAKWNMSISPKCSFCFTKPETVLHLLVECTEVDKMWRNLCKWVSNFYQIPLKEMDAVMIILNNYEGKEKC